MVEYLPLPDETQRLIVVREKGNEATRRLGS